MGTIAERRQITVMFVDLVGSTSRLNNCDPEEFFEFIIKYQSHVNKCVAKFGGYSARFVGDGVLIYFGWPTSHEDSAARSIRSAREIVTSIADIVDPHGEPAAVRVGIATGVVIIGEIQTQFGQPQVEVFGEAPHLANRLQGEGKPNTIIVCQETKNLSHGTYNFEELTTGKLKGIEGVQSVNQVMSESFTSSRFSKSGLDQLPTVGREKELEFIINLWPRAMESEGQIVCITGDIGYGKSHLVEAVQKQMRNKIDSSISVVRYQCTEHHKDSPYYPFVRRTDIWAGILAQDNAQERLDKFTKKMGTQLDEEMLYNISPVMGFPEIKRKNKFSNQHDEKEAVKKSIMQLAQLSIGQTKSLVIVEDLHWADPSTQELMRYFYDNIKDLRALMLVTCRDVDLVPRAKLDNHHRIALAPLPNHDAKKLVSVIANANQLTKEMVTHIVEKTDGIPLYIEAYTKALLEPNNALASASSFHEPISVPSSLNNILLMRLDHLGDLKNIAQICSTIGHEFSCLLVEQISGFSHEKIDYALDALTEEKILIRLKHKNTISYSFRHALVQQIAYESQLKKTRKKMHLKIAQTLKDLRPHQVKRNPGFIARHYSLAGLHKEATNYLLEASQISMSQFANREALGYAQNGLEHLGSFSNTDEREELELEFQMINALAGRAVNGFAKQSTIAAFERMMELSLKRGSERHHTRAIRGLFIAMHSEGRYDDALAMAGRMINASGKDAVGLTTAHHMHAIPLIWQGNFAQAKSELELASDYYDKSAKNIPNPRIQALTRIQFSQSLVAAFMGHPQEALKSGLDALSNVKKTNATLEIANGYLSVCNAMRIIRHPDLLKTAREFEVFIADHELPYYSTAISAFVGLGMFEEGDKSQGLELLKRGWQQFTKTQSRLNQVFYMAELADSNLQTGNLVEARIAVENGFALMEQYGERNFEAELFRIHGEIMLAEKTHSPKLIVAEIEKAIAVAIKQSAGTFEKRARNTLARAQEELSTLVE